MDLQAHDNRSVTAFFDNRAHAESSVETLTNVGIPAASIRMVEGNDPAGASEASPQEEKGFFEAIGDFSCRTTIARPTPTGCGAAATYLFDPTV